MTDDRPVPRPHDPDRVSLDKLTDIEYWTHRFGATRERLEEAVENVGHAPHEVERWLEAHPHIHMPSGMPSSE